jgi:hypothetical protein
LSNIGEVYDIYSIGVITIEISVGSSDIVLLPLSLALAAAEKLLEDQWM